MKRGKGVIMQGDKNDPLITGYLILGDEHYQIVGERMSKIRTHLHLREVTEKDRRQKDLFNDEHSGTSGERKRDLV